jgi:ring-1,2-phenylacetyl-CoA epoxidase subunit PaaC
MGFDTAYEAITEESEDLRWAFGTGFADPMAGISTAVPAGADPAALAAYCLMLGDDALIMSHRLQQWLARAPELEEETALANIALDLLGQARLLLSRAGQADGSGRSEDDLAFGRQPAQFRSVILAEGADADFGGLIARLLVFSTWRLALLDRLRASADPVLAAVAAKGVTEITYHRDYAAQWLLRLAGGTGYSRARLAAGLAAIAPDLPELFAATPEETILAAEGIAADPAALAAEVTAVLTTVLHHAGLLLPTPTATAAADPATVSDPAVSAGLAAAADPAVVSDPAVSAGLAAAADPAVVSGPAVSAGLAAAADPAVVSGPAVSAGLAAAADPAVVSDPAVSAGPVAAADPTGVPDPTVSPGLPEASDPAVPAGRAVSSDPALAAAQAILAAIPDPARATPPPPGASPLRGRAGQHTPALAQILDELQEVTRAHPGARW